MFSLRLGLIGISLLGLVQCGSQSSISTKVDFKINPKSPIVINTDFTLNPGLANEKKITGPWFSLNYTVTNNSDRPITIQSLVFSISGITSTGSIANSTASIDPADYGPVTGNDTFLTEVLAGATATPPTLFYIGGLNKAVTSGAFSVTVEVQGWVGTSTLPEDRLYKVVSFSTK